jgi:hypothetical protein
MHSNWGLQQEEPVVLQVSLLPTGSAEPAVQDTMEEVVARHRPCLVSPARVDKDNLTLVTVHQEQLVEPEGG